MTMSGTRQRLQLRRPIWIILLVSFVSLFLIIAYIYPPRSFASCFLFSSGGCDTGPFNWPPPVPPRALTDDETASEVVIRELLKTPLISPKIPKIAFLFLTPGSLPFEKLWDIFFRGYDDRFTVYVHASDEKPVHVSQYFIGRDIRSEKVGWGKFSMVEAERRLLATALLDPDNQHFVLLSESCIPVHNFEYVYDYLMFTNVSFVDCWHDPGPHGINRYSEHMLPEVEKKHFRKGSQWFTMKRKHAIIVMMDSLYYTKFKHYCRMKDPGGIANWSVTYVDWSEMKWHPKAFRAKDISYELLKNITLIDDDLHYTSDEKRTILHAPCTWNGMKRPCYLFARKFYPESLDNLINLLSNYTTLF